MPDAGDVVLVKAADLEALRAEMERGRIEARENAEMVVHAMNRLAEEFKRLMRMG